MPRGLPARHACVFDLRLPVSDPLYPMTEETLPWQPIFRLKLANSDYSSLFVAMAFRHGLQYRHYDFKNVHLHMATLNKW